MPSGPRKVNRRRFLRRAAGAVGTTAAATSLYAWRIEPHWVEVVEQSMPLAGLPPAWAGKRVVQLSDLHCGPIVSREFLQSNLARVRAMRPDLVVVTGDWMTCFDTEEVDPTIDLVRDAQIGAPIVGILGNHDYGRGFKNYSAAGKLTAGLRDAGVVMLRNDAVEVDGLPVAGVDDLWSGNCRIRRAINAMPSGRGGILLAHNPDTVDRHPHEWQDFRGWVLSGHTHAGQVRAPGYGAIVTPIRNKRYVAGLVELDEQRRLYVNRALGYKHRLRLLARPEITIFHLSPA